MLAPCFDDELWLSEEPDGLDVEGDALASKSLKMVILSHCRQNACRKTCVALWRFAGRSNCPVLTRTTSPGRAWVLRGALWPFKLGASPQNRRSAGSTA
eukprot:1494895-Amphidinium_carterae.1